jgi:hypothetical protein
MALPKLEVLYLRGVHDSDDSTPWNGAIHGIQQRFTGRLTLRHLHFADNCCGSKTAARLITLAPHLQSFTYQHVSRTFGDG